jgi:class 3 adenylate cyclase/tetratricopeptide (TPR) repeat protein
LTRLCPECREETHPGARLCHACGHPLEPAAAPPQPEASSTPADLADKMRRHRPAEGERRTVTVVFADAVGSTPLAEQLGEEEMYSFMRQCLSLMTEAVHRYEGYVASFTGDGIMALFGAPIAHEDSARQAVAAALRMQRSLRQQASKMQQRHGVGCRFRVGLNTGPVVVGTVTDDLQMDFTAIGDTVNLAARMEQAADPGSVFISEATHRIVGDFFDCAAVGELAVKGKTQPVRSWRVLGEKPVQTRFEVAAERGLSRFVGRSEELAVLEGGLEKVRLGTGQVVLVSGEAGIGKSRLLLELRQRASGDDVAWIEGHCISYGANIPYLPVIDLLKKGFGVQEGDGEADVIRRVDEVVSGWEGPARGAAPYVKHVLSVDPGDADVAAMDPRERRVGVLEALRTLLVQESSRRPYVVVAEDLHWADEISRETLVALADAVPSAPILLLLTHRPGYRDTLGERPYLTRLALGRLDDDESLALAEDIVQGAGLPPELQRLIAGRAEGNPFYVEEVTKGLVEAGVLARSNGTYRLSRRVDEINIPDTIQEVVLSRIDRLHRDAKRALQLASVIGREFTARLLDRISDMEAKLSEVLGDLKALELIYEKAFFPELAYMFKHALTHDVAYGTLLAERRRALHRLVGAAVEELYRDRLAEHYEILAHHYDEGYDWDKALEYLTKAGDKATDAYANDDALRFYARAIEACEKLGDKALPALASLAAKRGFVNFGIGDVPAAIADLDRMVGAARHVGSRSLEGIGLAHRGLLELYNHDFEQAEATLRSAWAVVEEGFEEVRPLASLALAQLFAFSNRWEEVEPLLSWAETVPVMPDPFTDGWWNWYRGLVQYWRGHFDQAVGTLEAFSEDAERMVTIRLANWWTRGMALGGRGEYESALALLLQTLDTCERVGDWQVRPRVVNTIGWVFAELEDHEQALGWNRSGVELAGSIPGLPDAEIEGNARLNLADNLIALGRPDEAEEQFKALETVVRDPKPAQRWMLWRWSLHFFSSYGELWLERGDPVTTLGYGDECLALAEQTSSRKYVVKGRRLRGRAFLAQRRLGDAERELMSALQGAVELANPPQLWKTHAALGDLRQAQGRAEDAQRAYGAALSAIDAVAAGLRDERLRKTLLSSEWTENVRRAAGRGPGATSTSRL